MKTVKYDELRIKLEEVEADFHRTQEIQNDPMIQVLKFSVPEDREVAALIAAVFAYGNVKQVNRSLETIFELLGPTPSISLRAHQGDHWKKTIPKNFRHRFNNASDLGCLLTWIGEALRQHGSLEALFMKSLKDFSTDDDIGGALENFIMTLTSLPHSPFKKGRGALFFFPKPSGKSACKRLMLFLRWVAGHGPMDLNLWKNVPKSKLLIPVDTHVLRISKHLGLTKRKDNSWRTAQEITGALKNLDAEDPTRFDFALCHLGISKECPSRLKLSVCSQCRMNTLCVTYQRPKLKKSV